MEANGCVPRFLAACDVSLGFASIWEPDSFLHHLHVDPSYQRQGIGTALLQRAAQLVPSGIGLKCQTQNLGALRFYANHGFTESDERGQDQYGEWVRLDRESGATVGRTE